MRSLNHFEAVTVLREAADQVLIRVYREPADLELVSVYAAQNQGQASVESPQGQTKVRYLVNSCFSGIPSVQLRLFWSAVYWYFVHILLSIL